MSLDELFRIDNQVAVVTGGGGVLPGEMAKGLAMAGAKLALIGRTMSKLEAVANDIEAAGGEALPLSVDVVDRAALEEAHRTILDCFGRIDILVNGAGGANPQASTSDTLSFFDMTEEAIRATMDLNYLGTLFPCQVFGRTMGEQKSGVIINISSMTALKPLTRVAIYGGAKAAVSNLTEWLAVHMAENYDVNIRVNAIAPGFFVGEQNRRFLLNEDGTLTPRGQLIVDHTPMRQFGEAADLVGATIWLASPAARFVTGIVVPVDGGFSAFSGV